MAPVDGAAPRIVLVDADGTDSARLGDCVQDLGYVVCGVAPYERAVQAAEDTGADLALIELRRAGSREALETAARIGSRLDLPIVYLIDEGGGDLPKRAAASNPYGSVLPPFAPGQLGMTIDTALLRHARESGKGMW